MKKCTPEFKAWLARPGNHTGALGWLVQRADQSVFAFTTHDQDFAFDLEAFIVSMGYGAPPGIASTGSQTYPARSSFTASNVATAAALNIDNMELVGVLDSAVITEDDLRSGIWDYAKFCVFLLNYADLTMGALIERCGNLGDVSTGRTTFTAEMSGLLRAFQKTIGRLTSARCDADVFDARCKADPGGMSAGSPSFALTATGALTSVGDDGMTLFDTSRTEPGPDSPTVGIAAISNANPGVVTMDDNSLGIINYQPVILSDIAGPVDLNGQTVARNIGGGGTTFDLPVDTTDTSAYPPYGGGGIVSTVGTSGFFTGGLITMTSGPNNGRSMEVGSYVPGQWSLWLPFPVLCTVGDTYTMTAGCNKEMLGDCKLKYDNVVNNRSFHWLPGNDKIIQVGRRS